MLGETGAALTLQADARKSRDDQRQQRQRKLEASIPSLVLLRHKSTPCSGLSRPQNTDSAEQTHTSIGWVLWAPLCPAAWLQSRQGAAPGAPAGTCRTQCPTGGSQALGRNLIWQPRSEKPSLQHSTGHGYHPHQAPVEDLCRTFDDGESQRAQPFPSSQLSEPEHQAHPAWEVRRWHLLSLPSAVGTKPTRTVPWLGQLSTGITL